MSYGRARLWIGVSTVGAFVTLALLGLAIGAPSWIGSLFGVGLAGGVASVAVFVLAYALVHVPFDVLGGFVLPRRYGKDARPFASFALSYLRGAMAHGLVLVAAGGALLVGGARFGAPGLIGVGVGLSVLLLAGRPLLMRAIGAIRTRGVSGARTTGGLPIRMVESGDIGFTGGITGVIRPRGVVTPSSWVGLLSPETLNYVVDRRDASIRTWSWHRGRLVSVVFTWAGIVFSAAMVGESARGASGILEFSLWFTLWSFVGLLTLPTLSRRGVLEVDRSLRERGYDERAIRDAMLELDDLQDGERERPAGVEAVFHPIPSVRNRAEHRDDARSVGALGAARTSVYLSASGLGLLGRAVHCNCGRPELWVFLPSD